MPTERLPTVSVLIPTFDRPHYLTEALHSVVAQDVDAVEVIVGDDGRRGQAVVEQLAEHRIRYQRNPNRLGIANNWNRLLDSARGRYLALLMDDDRWDPSFLRKVLAVFDEHPDVDLVFTNHLFDRDGERRVRDCDLAEGRY